MIVIKNLEWATPMIAKKLYNSEEKQLARKIEKFLLNNSIVCELEVTEC